MRLVRPVAVTAAAIALSAASAAAPTPAQADPVVFVGASYKATSVRSIEWIEGHFQSLRPIGNPKIKVFMVTQAGRIFWVAERNWRGDQYSGSHKEGVNQSFAEDIGSACMELYEGGIFVDKSCVPIVP